MKNLILLLLISLTAMKSCKNNHELSQEQEEQNLEEMYVEIEALANSQPCTDPNDWMFTEIGAKACGGPVGYIPYSGNINTESFLEKVKNYTAAQEAFNKKWGIVSDCSLPPKPSGIECRDGAPHFVY